MKFGKGKAAKAAETKAARLKELEGFHSEALHDEIAALDAGEFVDAHMCEEQQLFWKKAIDELNGK